MSILGAAAGLEIGNPLPAIVEGLFGRLFGWVKDAWHWLATRSPMELLCLALTAIALVEHFQIAAERRHRERAEQHDAATSRALGQEQRAHAAERARYRAAQAQAKALNEAEIARTVAARHASDERTIHALRDNIGSLRDLSARGQLRPWLAAAQGATGGAEADACVAAPCRAIDPTWLCLSPSDVLRAAENEERQDRLIDAIEGQAAVDPNKP